MNYMTGVTRPIDILLVEDNPGDVRLAVEALKDCKVGNSPSVVRDGVEALSFLRREGTYADAPRPDLILLDLNLPRKSGCEVLSEIKNDPDLKVIPVLVLTTSESESDVNEAYQHHANCYMTKPVEFNKFISLFRAIEGFWVEVVRLPS